MRRAALYPGKPVTPPPGVRPCTTKIQTLYRCAIVAVTEDRAARPQLIEAECAVNDVTGHQTEALFEIVR